jgi:hypothetical protein
LLEFNEAVIVLSIAFARGCKYNILYLSKIGEVLCDVLERDILRHAVDVQLMIIVVSLDIGDDISNLDYLQSLDNLP